MPVADFREMKNAAIQAEDVCQAEDAHLFPGFRFECFFPVISQSKVFFFLQPLGLLCFSNGGLYKQRSPSAFRWVNKRRSKGRR